jgi:hypothetical protein
MSKRDAATTIHTLKGFVCDLKVDALHAGRYPPPCKAELWEQRDKSRAFRCITYNTLVRRINALEGVISDLEGNRRLHRTLEEIQQVCVDDMSGEPTVAEIQALCCRALSS